MNELAYVFFLISATTGLGIAFVGYITCWLAVFAKSVPVGLLALVLPGLQVAYCLRAPKEHRYPLALFGGGLVLAVPSGLLAWQFVS